MMRRVLNLGAVSILLAGTLLGVLPKIVYAANATDWNAGKIIDDAVFTDSSSMSVSQIQDFLNAKVGTGGYGHMAGQCDTNGVATSELGGGTRAQYGAAHGNPAPFTCLKDYYEVPKTSPGAGMPANNYGGKPIPAGAESAAQLISDAAQRYSISPKVLLVTIQKESVGPLTTDDWPFASQYTYAMGAHCPDSGPGGSANCDPNYAGFSIQISESAALLRYYLDNMTQSWWPYKKPFVVNSILWNVSNTGCGAGDVYISSKATAALYTYTPYQPNQAALNNLYGLGDGCSAYGNRNFWRVFTDWFGSTQTNIPYAWTFGGSSMYADSGHAASFSNGVVNIQPGAKAYLEIKARNNGFEAWDQSFVHLATSHQDDRLSVFSDSSWLSTTRIGMVESNINPGDVGTFDFSITAPPATGTYYEYFNLVADGKGWLNDPGAYFLINVVNPRSGSKSNNTTLAPNTTLTPGGYLLSADGSTTLLINSKGIPELRSNARMTWGGGKGGTAQLLAMQSDGNLVEYSNTGSALWSSGTSGNPGASLVLQPDGNMVIYSTTGQPLWASGTANAPDYYSVPFYSFTGGTLLPGQSMNTPKGNYHLELQRDGNLVLYNVGQPLWATGTAGMAIANLSMQPDGNLVLYSNSGKAVWSSGTFGSYNAGLALQADGNLVLYSQSGQPIWNTKTATR
jgi:hypothetical protein